MRAIISRTLFLVAGFSISLSLLAGCSKKTAFDESKLKPVATAFGFTIGEKAPDGTEEVSSINDTPPFSTVFLMRTSDGKICEIAGMGVVEGNDLRDAKQRLISILAEKYGARPAIPVERHIQIGAEDYYFGTTNRPAHLMITDNKTNAFLQLEYFDRDLLDAFHQEQDDKDKADDAKQKAALSHGL
ncbi:MAG: hypothetical protein P4N60_01045 [Verrucomicrobiae bacterium]|nr:hypothetical protein [Verrucomicrobiae bacterium]